MTFREKLYAKAPTSLPELSLPTLGHLADWSEYAAFAALAGAILSLAGKGLAVAFGFAALLTVGAFLNAFIGLFITFLALLFLSIILDGGHEYREFARDQLTEDEEEQTQEQTRRV